MRPAQCNIALLTGTRYHWSWSAGVKTETIVRCYCSRPQGQTPTFENYMQRWDHKTMRWWNIYAFWTLPEQLWCWSVLGQQTYLMCLLQMTVYSDCRYKGQGITFRLYLFFIQKRLPVTHKIMPPSETHPSFPFLLKYCTMYHGLKARRTPISWTTRLYIPMPAIRTNHTVMIGAKEYPTLSVP